MHGGHDQSVPAVEFDYQSYLLNNVIGPCSSGSIFLDLCREYIPNSVKSVYGEQAMLSKSIDFRWYYRAFTARNQVWAIRA